MALTETSTLSDALAELKRTAAYAASATVSLARDRVTALEFMLALVPDESVHGGRGAGDGIAYDYQRWLRMKHDVESFIGRHAAAGTNGRAGATMLDFSNFRG